MIAQLLGLCLVWTVAKADDVYAQDIVTFDAKTIRISRNDAKFNGSTLVEMGLTIPNGTEAVDCLEGDECYDYGVAKLVIIYDGHCEKISWTTSELAEIKDCVLALDAHWFGGGQQFTQPWPIEKTRRIETAFVSADMLQRTWWYGGLSERYWIASHGLAVRVEDNVPLFFSMPDEDDDDDADRLCFASRYEDPFVQPDENTPLQLTYSLCYGDDVRQVHEATYSKFFDYPDEIPDERMMTDPIWSTWAEYKTEVNDSRVLGLAEKVQFYGFNNSQIEIDDNWETCYGSAVFNPDRFPDTKALVDELHEMGFRTTLWIHPFINLDCDAYPAAAEAGFLMKNASGDPQITSWWQGDEAGHVDFTNPEAIQWWTQRLIDLQEATGMDSFKFDAGESSWFPDDYVLSIDKELWPNGFTSKYVDVVSNFGPMIEVRVGHLNQRHPIFFRMLDKDSNWSNQNGLKTMIPSLLHSGILGYPYVLPDMVGGNAYIAEPSAELYIRWAQSNTFMPSYQFSILPWNFDSQSDQVVELSKRSTSLHTEYAATIIELAQEGLQTKVPMTRPTWWLCPQEEACLLADQQFLLGDDLLAAPIVEEGATTKTVVIPPGMWVRQDTGESFSGPTTVTLADLTIESNVYFLKTTTQ